VEKRFESSFGEYWAEVVHQGEQDTEGNGSYGDFLTYLTELELEEAIAHGDKDQVLAVAAAILDLEATGEEAFDTWRIEYFERNP